MISLKIDGENIKVPEGSTLLQAAEKAGVEIPVMCYDDRLDHFASCMVCMVKSRDSGQMLASCSVKAEEGMDIITGDEEVFEARKASLELLLSDHTGDCQAPCQLACPAHMNIPLMNRLLGEGKVDEALQVVQQDIPIPSILGRICHAPCEGACRRKTIDEPVSICLLKRYAGDIGNLQHVSAKTVNQQALKKVIGNKKVAVIGAGPAGLSAACYLQRAGYQCILYEKSDRAGGLLHLAEVMDDSYPEVLDREISQILDTGIELKTNMAVDKDLFEKLLGSSDAIVVATGEIENGIRSWNIESGKNGITIDKSTYQTSHPPVFAIGNVVRSVKSAVRSVGHGKEVAASVHQYLSGEAVKGYPKMFNSRFGKLREEEFGEYLKESHPGKRMEPVAGQGKGFDHTEMQEEAGRCLHCDCRDLHTCKLRIHADRYAANQRRYKGDAFKPVTKVFVHDAIIYEPQKCIKCGICVRLTALHKEKYGFTFIGRGFDVRIGIPFDESLEADLSETAKEVAMACPTGALALK
ncbi:MAG: (2Fe-2S)-binding protein [Bacteroidales bacterium]|nr:(2Fe-2S)-binding protein [Bacteroidales bacterium]